MNMFNKLRDHFSKEPAGEDLGQRVEILITLTLAVLSTLATLAVYQTLLVLIVVIIVNCVGLFTLYHAFRSQYRYLGVFPAAASCSILIAVLFEGKGSHDLLWMGNLGFFLLANVQNRKKIFFPVLLAAFMVGAFAFTGFAEIYGLLENPYQTNIRYVALNSFVFIVIMAAIIVVFRRHYGLLLLASESKSANIKSNQELKEINQTLESRVESRARELSQANQQLQQRAMRLQRISEISQEISSNIEQQLQELLNLITRSISEKLDFYHVGIFLLDENREYAVLRATNSAGGQRMLERHHQLKVGGTGIVGYVSQGGRPRIALDTGSDAVFFNNPDLPETRSEMAVPLKYGSKVIGVLDIQSTMSSAFTEEDANLIGTLANQVAIAVYDLLSREQPGFDGYKTTRRRRTSSAGQKPQGYSYNPDGTISIVKAMDDPAVDKALASGETVQTQPSKNAPSILAVPVKYRDQVIGVIQIEATEANRKWTEDEILVVQSISERAAFALENARLFEQTRRRAEQEETIARVTSQIGASTDFNHIMQITIEELGRTLGATRTFIQLDTSSGDDMAAPETATDQRG